MSRNKQKGSALLIVFVFAAMIAIMLYMEMPVAVFEARRQKEQLLMDRGNEYAHAVKLYVRKFGSYPASLDQLEDTNRMRFLRHRFKDPFTGKDDWRLLHAGPGGMLVDSKVKTQGVPGMPGQTSRTNSGSGANSNFASSSGFGSSSDFGSTSGFGSNSGSGSNSGLGSNSSFGSSANSGAANSGFGSSSFGSSGFGTSGSFASNSDAKPEVVVPPVRERPPAVRAGDGETQQSTADTGNADQQDPAAPLLPGDQAEQLQKADEVGGNALPQESGANAPGQAGQAGQAGQSGGGAQANGGGSGQITPFSGARPQGSNGLGRISGGGIAGVASKAGGKTIKEVNDQTDYSLWEFYYDPSKDLKSGATGPGGAPMQTGAPANAPQNGNSGFGAAPAPMEPQNPSNGTTAGPQPQPQQQQQMQPQNPQMQPPA